MQPVSAPRTPSADITMALALFYLAGPVMIMAELLTPFLSVPALVLCFAWLREFQLFLFPAGRTSTDPVEPSRFRRPALLAAATYLVVVAALWLLASGIGSFTYCRYDYVKHSFVFGSLLTGHLPIVVDPGDGSSTFLHYYFAYYILPARLYQGLHLLIPAVRLDHVLIVIYCLALLGSLRVLSVNLRISALALLLVMVFTGGLDVAGRAMFDATWRVAVRGPAGLPIFDDLDWWGVPFAPQSLTMNLFWAPQHFFGALIGVALLSCIFTQQRSWAAKYLHCAIVIAASSFWSPYVAIGLAVVVLGVMARLVYRCDFSLVRGKAQAWRVTLRFVGAAAFLLVLAAFVIVFFAAAKPASPPSLIFLDKSLGDWLLSLVIRLTPALVVLALLAFGRGGLAPDRRADLLCTTGFLITADGVLLCFTHGVYDDWAMRTTLPVSILIATVFCRFLGEAADRLAKAGVIAVLALSSASSLNEIAQSTFFPRRCPGYGAYTLRDLGSLAGQYQGRSDSLLYRWLAR
jgi:hypothetical protein